MNLKLLVVGAAGAGLILTAGGCSSVTRGTPIAGAQINLNMTSGNCEILGKTEGESTKTSILCGFVRIIDGDKISVAGINFFEDQYAYQEKPGYFGDFLHPISSEDRAYYKALAATPEADLVAPKSFVTTETGIPFIYYTKDVTYVGKAMKFKGDNN